MPLLQEVNRASLPERRRLAPASRQHRWGLISAYGILTIFACRLLQGTWFVMHYCYRFLTAVVVVLAWCQAGDAWSLDHITFKRAEREQTIDGRIVVKAQDGGLMVQTPDGMLWMVTAEEQVKVTSDDAPFVKLTGPELGKRLLEVLPDGFEVHTTANYVILHNTSKAYAQWCGALFEQLYKAFTNYWSRRDFDLQKPEFPLVAVVFADKQSYAQFAQPELGDATGAIIGYYSLLTNRMTMYDLTGLESMRRPGNQRNTTEQIHAMLTRPESERTVATIIHEATHQIALNCGLETRYADVPLWVSEGLAIYFETPDMKSLKGWSNIGGVNRVRLAGFRDYLRRRPPDSLESLIVDDRRFRDTRTGSDAYAEAWALNFFLLRQKSKQYYDYTRLLAKKPPLVVDEPATRLSEFKTHFGDDLEKLDLEFRRFMMTVK